MTGSESSQKRINKRVSWIDFPPVELGSHVDNKYKRRGSYKDDLVSQEEISDVISNSSYHRKR